MPLTDRTNVPTPATNNHACSPKQTVDRPQAPQRIQGPNPPPRRLPTTEAELAQRLLEEPDFFSTIQPLYRVTPPSALLRVYLSVGCSIVNPSLQPTTSTKRTVALFFPRNRQYYSPGPVPKYVPTIKFSKNGVPGPSLKALFECPSESFNFCVDDSDDIVVQRNFEQKTFLQLDWPHLGSPKIWFRTYDGISRGALARNIAYFTHKLMFNLYPRKFPSTHRHNLHPLSPKNVDFCRLRVFSVQRYGDVWIPHIGLDITLT